MKTCLFFISILLCLPQMEAQTLSGSVSSDSILLGNYILFEVKIENMDVTLDNPQLDGFELVSGPNMSSSMSIINGDMSSSKTIGYGIKPLELGQYFIPPITVEFEGEFYETEPIELNVYPNPEGKLVDPQRNSMDDFFNLNRPRIFGWEQEETPEKKPPVEEAKPKRKLKKG